MASPYLSNTHGTSYTLSVKRREPLFWYMHITCNVYAPNDSRARSRVWKHLKKRIVGRDALIIGDINLTDICDVNPGGEAYKWLSAIGLPDCWEGSSYSHSSELMLGAL